MQQHTGQHILSGVMYRRFGYNTVAIHQGEDFTTIELDIEDISKEDIEEIETAAMELINRNLPMRTRWVKDSDLEKYDLRRQPKVSGDIRLVQLDTYDAVACGGIHTVTTGEVKLLKHISTEKIRGRVRLYWKIGERAMLDYDYKNETVLTLVDWFSAQPQELLPRVEASLQELNEQRKRANIFESRVARLTAQQLLRDAHGEPALITAEFEDEGKDFLKKLVQELPADLPWAACVINHQGESFQWLVAVSEQVEFDFNKQKKELLALIDGKRGRQASCVAGGRQSQRGDTRAYLSTLALNGGDRLGADRFLAGILQIGILVNRIIPAALTVK
ncbi:MAG: alanyl-tRNA editing protein [Spirochaetia bacterium]|nr:alanyl-tRNA editing protein [Spirochaetia bacterium]